MDTQLQAFIAWLALIAGLAGALAPFVQALVEATKQAAGTHLPARFYPAVAVLWGIILAQFITWAPPLVDVGFTWREALLVGAFAGLFAAGLFAYGKEKELGR